MIEDFLGLDAETLTIWHMVVRAVIVYVCAVIMVRIGEKRFLGKTAAFDVILGIMFGSIVSGAITGSTEFFPTLGAALTLVLMHWLFAFLAFRSDRFGTFAKGHNRTLVKDGEINWDEMRASHISEKDLMSALRSQANMDTLEDVREARLERSGEISVLQKQRQPKVLKVDVEDGVQTVHIRLE